MTGVVVDQFSDAVEGGLSHVAETYADGEGWQVRLVGERVVVAIHACPCRGHEGISAKQRYGERTDFPTANFSRINRKDRFFL